MKETRKRLTTIFLMLLIGAIGVFIVLNVTNEKKVASYVGSKNSNIYHRLDCLLVKEIQEKDKIWFDATIVNENARYEGRQYFPCQVCNPAYKK